ncbi:MAG: SEL1-like repeat protein [Oscillospiraceae bacterium]|nr:SEL1-like repeat protein [Oscillospiraceae bacterium]
MMDYNQPVERVTADAPISHSAPPTSNSDESAVLIRVENGDLNAVLEMAHNYYYGENGFEQDGNKSFYWVQRAVELLPKNAEAWHLLGLSYKDGIGTETDFQKAIDAFKSAADLGNVESMSQLGEVYYFDASDSEKHNCVEWLEKAHMHGDVYATELLGQLYRDGKYVPMDTPKAIQLFQEAAKKGDAVAASMLANLYWRGEEVAEDIPRANRYWTMAVDNGSDWEKALLYAGLAWFYGNGVEKDYVKARKALSRIDINDEANAILGSMCFEGVGGIVDRKEGEARLRKVFNSSDTALAATAMNNLGLYFYNSSNITEAISLFKRAIEKGSSDARVNLGNAYLNGRGVPKSIDNALYQYRMAAQQGNEAATQNLNTLSQSTDPNQRSSGTAYSKPQKKRHRVRGGILGAIVGFVIASILGQPTTILGEIIILIGIAIGIWIG